jgi:probable phosphoglycerate mutase
MLEGMTWDDILRDHPEPARRLSQDPEYVIPGGESLVQFRERVTATLRRLVSESDRAIAVVTHGGVLGIMYRVAKDLPLDAPRTYRTVNAGVNHFRHAAGRWRVVRWGDAEHLDAPGASDDF